MTDEHRVALVTGASRGIGKASALALAAAGFDVVVGARTVREGEGRDDSDTGGGRPIAGSLEATAEEIQRVGGRVLAARMDLLDRDSLTAAVETALSEWGRIDVLVNNAVHTGAGSMERFADLDIETIETKLSANVVAQLVLIKAVLPHMVARGSGRVIDITSAVALSDPPAPAGEGGWGLGYAITKGAFHRVAGILAVEHARDGVLFYNVEPGYVVTERMEVNQDDLGFTGRFRGAPPSVPAAVVAWLAVTPDPAAEGVANGATLTAQRFALERGLHPDWRTAP